MTTWPLKTLTYSYGVDAPDGFRARYERALAAIAAACGVSFAAAPPASANLVSVSGPIDGPGGDLALTYEPYPGIPATASLGQTFDTADLAGLTPDEWFVMCLHEHGHFLGRQHSPAGVSSVMSARLDPTLSGLTPYDVGELRAAYGPPSTPTAPPADPTPAAWSGHLAAGQVVSVTVPSEGDFTISVTPQTEAPMQSPTLTAATAAAPATPPAPAPAPQHPVTEKILGLLTHLPGEVDRNVNVPELEKVVAAGVESGKGLEPIVEDVLAAAPVLFPDMVYARLAARLLRLVVHLVAAHAASARAA